MQDQPGITPKVNAEHPLQERDCGPVLESPQETAQTILTERRLEVQREAKGTAPLFVP